MDGILPEYRSIGEFYQSTLAGLDRLVERDELIANIGFQLIRYENRLRNDEATGEGIV
jgi:hypothetical protein